MQPLPWFPFYYVDFFKDEKVQLMSLAQVGMYLHLLAHEWHEGSLPNQYGALVRIAHLPQVSEVQGQDEQDLLFVIKSCFVKNGRPGRLMNQRLESIRAEQLTEIQKNKDRTAKARQTLSDKRSTVAVIDNVTNTVTELKSESNPKSESKKKILVSQKKPHPSGEVETSTRLNPTLLGFDRFWNVYPRKKSKGQAERAWVKLSPDEPLQDRLLQALERAKTSADWLRDKGQFIPYPATWLHAKGWEDEIGAEGQDATQAWVGEGLGVQGPLRGLDATTKGEGDG